MLIRPPRSGRGRHRTRPSVEGRFMGSGPRKSSNGSTSQRFLESASPRSPVMDLRSRRAWQSTCNASKEYGDLDESWCATSGPGRAGASGFQGERR